MEAEEQEEEEEAVQVEQEEEEKVEKEEKEEDLAPACRTARPPPQVLTLRSQPKEIKISLLL